MDTNEAQRATGLRCRNCGSTRFETPDASQSAVCIDCGVESQDFLNTAFEDWGEESKLYKKEKGNVLRRHTYVSADKRRRKGRKKKESAAISFAARLAATGHVVASIATALVRDCGVDAAAKGAVAAAWTAYAARARRGAAAAEVENDEAPAPAPAAADEAPAETDEAPPEDWFASQDSQDSQDEPPADATTQDDVEAARAEGDKKKEGGAARLRRKRQRAPRAPRPEESPVVDLDADAYKSVGMEAVLPLVYDACRRAQIPVLACDLSRWSWHGLLPYLSAWRSGLDEAPREALGRPAAHNFSPRRAPGPGEIVYVAELRFCPYHDTAWRPMGPAEACALHAEAIVDGGAFRRFVVARAARLLRLATHAAPELRVTEPRALAAVCLACCRYADGFVVGPGTDDGTFPVLPWTEADAAINPRSADDAAAYSTFVSARERRPASQRDHAADIVGEAALEAYADALDRRAAQLDAGPPPARPRRRRPLAPDAVVSRGGVGADAGALVSLGAERLQCPPGVFRAVMDDIRDAVDAATFADDRSDPEHAARLDHDTREVVLDSSFY